MFLINNSAPIINDSAAAVNRSAPPFSRPLFRITVIFCLLALLSQSCRRGDPMELTKSDLKNALYHSLITAPHYDSTKVRYHVLDVIYYDDNRTKSYICKFKVTMTLEGKDTTGTMYCYIAKDFSSVRRKW